MSTPTPCPTDVTGIWTDGLLPAPGNPFTFNGRRAILVATRARTVLGTPIMYREVMG